VGFVRDWCGIDAGLIRVDAGLMRDWCGIGAGLVRGCRRSVQSCGVAVEFPYSGPNPHPPQVRNWGDTFTKYLDYCDSQEAETKRLQRLSRQEEEEANRALARGEGEEASSGAAGVAPVEPAKVKPLTAFERRELERLEGRMSDLSDEEDALQVTSAHSTRTVPNCKALPNCTTHPSCGLLHHLLSSLNVTCPQARVDSFDPARDGYTDLQEWTEQVKTLQEQLESVELKWLELAERA
jgi:hypothetical protein